jgi:hypothetical protein
MNINMKIENFNLENWSQICNENGINSTTFQPKFIEIVKESYNVKSLQLIIYDKENPILGFVVYYKNNNVIHPSQYFYTAVWENSNSKLIIQKAYILLIENLTSTFKNIRFRFSPEIIDLRPFILKGFLPVINYTYYLNLLNIDLNSKLLARERKAERIGLKFNWKFNLGIIDQNIKGLKNLGYKDSHTKPLDKMIRMLYENNFLIGVSAEIDNIIIGSALIMIDKENNIALNLLITSEKKNYDIGLHSALYINIFNKLRDNGYILNDLYGANNLGTGNFKANFGGDLKPHYTLDYNYLKNRIKFFLKTSKMIYLLFI